MLFTDEDLDLAPLMTRAAIATPLGRFVFGVEIGGATLLPAASTAYRFGDDGILYHWRLAQAEAELLICTNPIDLAGMFDRSDVQAAFLRVQATSGSFKVGFSARLVGAPRGVHGGYDGGQNYLGLTWHKGPTTLSLATPDEEGLHSRCRTALPTRWRDLIPAFRGDGTCVNSDDRRWVRIQTPALEPPERCELGYAVAWKDCVDDEDDEETSMAVSYGYWPNRKDIKPTPRGWGNNVTPPHRGKKKS